MQRHDKLCSKGSSFLSCLGLWKDVYCKLVFLWLKRVCCCFCTKKGENVKMNYVFWMIRWLDIHLSQKFDRPLSSRNYFFPYQRVFYFTIPAVWGQIRSKITHVTPPDILTVKKVMVSLYFRPSFESVTHNGYILWQRLDWTCNIFCLFCYNFYPCTL